MFIIQGFGHSLGSSIRAIHSEYGFTVRVDRGLPSAAGGVGKRLPCAITIGNFDGVHLGHQALLAELRAAADRLGVEATVMTFEPHPREYFADRAGKPDAAPKRIANLRDKLEALSAAGVDRVIVEHFNARFAGLSADDFIRNVLLGTCQARWLMVGEDFRFGKGRSGDLALLRAAGVAHGFELHSLPTVTAPGDADLRISSSAVRAALAAGDFRQAAQLLGRPYFISGRVIHGAKLGRSIGFPTANLRVVHHRPAIEGIFVVQMHGVGPQPLPGVASIGRRPTVDDSGRVLLEVFLLDYQGDLYGKLVRVEFLHKLRDEEKYIDLPTLTTAIGRDVDNARRWFADQRDSNQDLRIRAGAAR